MSITGPNYVPDEETELSRLEARGIDAALGNVENELSWSRTLGIEHQGQMGTRGTLWESDDLNYGNVKRYPVFSDGPRYSIASSFFRY